MGFPSAAYIAKTLDNMGFWSEYVIAKGGHYGKDSYENIPFGDGLPLMPAYHPEKMRCYILWQLKSAITATIFSSAWIGNMLVYTPTRH